MFEFLVETYASRNASSAPTVDELSLAAKEVSRAGAHVRLVRVIPVPEEETCFYLYRAHSVTAVRDAATRAGLSPDRISEVAPTRGIRTASATERSPSEHNQPTNDEEEQR